MQRTIAARRLVKKGERVLCACSGGADSTVMLDVLSRLARDLEISLVVASIDHGLRPGAAVEVASARAHAEARGLPFVHVELAIAPGPSVQARAREARYAALHRVAEAEGARRIAVGHTLDDQAETVLHRLLRGAGLRGLRGIAPKRSDGVIRPLIDCSREAVRFYAADRGLAFLDDPSNVDMRFARARLRAQIMPLLAVESRQVAVHFARLADDARAAVKVLEQGAKGLASGDALELEPLRACGEASRREALAAFAAQVTGRRPGRAQLEALDDAVTSGRGEIWLSGGHAVTIVSGRLVPTEKRRRQAPRRRSS